MIDRALVFLWKVDVVRDQRLDLENAVPKLDGTPGERTVELADGHPMSETRSGIDEIGDGLGLQQIHSAIKDCPPSDLTGEALACPRVAPGTPKQRRHNRTPIAP